jgi:hypothetical protein
MLRPHVSAIAVANIPRYSLDSEDAVRLISHDLDDDEDDVEYEADDRHGGVRRAHLVSGDCGGA